MGVEVENTHRQAKVAFGPFELDLNAHQLRRQGRLLKLQELPLRLLTVLVEAPGELVTHERLQKELWGDTVVNFDDGLHTAVRKLREALGDSATTPRFIATVARKGYRFIAPVNPCNGLQQRPRPGHRWRRTRILSALALLALALAAAWLWVRAYVTGSIDVPTLSDVVPLTSYPGTQRSPSLSPDGRKFAFAWTGFTGDNLDIYVQNVDNGTPSRLTSDPAADDYPTWSPDGSRIAFIRSGVVYLVPSGGGKERELARAAGPGLDWSPDGSLLAISNRESDNEPLGIFVVSVATGQRQRITQPSAPARDEYPEFSWDGRQIAFVRADTVVGDVWVIDRARRTPARRLSATGQPIGELAWTPDDRFVIFGAQQGLLRVPFHSSSPQAPVRVATSDRSARQPVISRALRGERGQLVFSRSGVDTDIWSMPVGHPASPLRVTNSTLPDHGPTLSPDGARIAFCSERTGVEEIWACDANGLHPVQLTFLGKGFGATSPSWSPDGVWIAFDAIVQGNRDIYLVPAKGGKVRRLTDHPAADAQPSWSHDGQVIYFMSARSGTHQVWKMRADGSGQTQLTKGGGYQAFESPDGRSVFYSKERQQRGIWSVPVGGGSETPLLDAAWHNGWAVAKDGLYYLDFDQATSSAIPVVRFDFTTGQRINVAKLPAPVARNVPALTVRPDGRLLLWVGSADRESGLMLARDFRW